MFQASCKPVQTFSSPKTVTPNPTEFRGGKFHVTIMHGQTFDENNLAIFGKGAQYSGNVVIQNIRGKTMAKSDLQFGRLEAWQGEYHWAGYDSNLPWMKVSALQPPEMQIIIYHMNRKEKHETFGRAVFSCLSFPDDNIHQCVLPIETIPDMMGNSTIVGSISVNIQYVSAVSAKKLRLGDSHRFSTRDTGKIILRVGFDDKGYMKGGTFTASVLSHGNKGEFQYALDDKTNTTPPAKYKTKISMRTIKVGDPGRVSEDPRRCEYEVEIDLKSVEANTAAFFVVVAADKPLTNLQDIQNINCEAINGEDGQGIASYDVLLRRPATAMMFARLVRVQKNGDEADWKFGAFCEMEFNAHNFGYLIPNCMNTLLDGSLEGAQEGTEEHRLVNLNVGEVFSVEDCFAENSMINEFSLGLQWDMFEGMTLDLDLGCLCLDADLQLIDMCHFKQLVSEDEAIKHGGDTVIDAEDKDDDEEIHINLGAVNPKTHYVAFYVSSYEGKELNEVESCYAHFYVTATKRDIFTFVVDDGSDNSVFGSNCAVLTTIIFKLNDKWYFKNAASGSNSNIIEGSVPHLQEFIKEHKLKETQQKILDSVPDGLQRLVSLQES